MSFARTPHLSDVFTAIAYKKLAAVDLPNRTPNYRQHEIGATKLIRQFFITDHEFTGTVDWHYFSDDNEPEHEFGQYFKFHDSRENKPDRSPEWRIYYRGQFLSRAAPGDLLVLARPRCTPWVDERHIVGMAFQQGSSWHRSAQLLFGTGSIIRGFSTIADEELNHRELRFAEQQILSGLGFDIELPPSPSDEDLVTEKFSDHMPPTKEMSSFAREVTKLDGASPDDLLIAWIEREESLFRALERVILQPKIEQGFSSVDEFMEVSMQAHQRRKSRMGHALENHLTVLFNDEGIGFTSQATTEKRRGPDFLFPGENEYRNMSFPSELLLMMAAKATLKDRWRQILQEANRIATKHLCTLQTGISRAQSDEIRNEGVQLVVPAGLFITFHPEQVQDLMTISDFIELARKNQSAADLL